MATRGKKVSYGQIDEVDRISDLPECILHHILSFIDTKEACRTSILSKKWAAVWDTVPFLDFRSHYFVKAKSDFQDSPQKYYEQDSVDRYVNFIDRTMQRYSQQNLSIKKLKLELPVFDSNLTSFIDRWLRIAVLNNLEELNLYFSLRDSPEYKLPEILFSSKSLKSLECCNVELPYYRVMKLTSLQTLKLNTVFVDEDMLQHIISSCPLIILGLSACIRLTNISIPRLSNIKLLIVGNIPAANLNINQETGSLQTFEYSGASWPCKISTVALRNLKKLRINFANISDEVFAYLLTELTLVDTLFLLGCKKLRNLNISSNRLRELHFLSCDGLKNAIIDAPNLAFFSYNGHQRVHICFTNIQPQCDAYFDIPVDYCVSNDTSWFVNLKKFLAKSNICKVLNLYLLYDISTKSELNVDELRKILIGPVYALQELKLYLSRGRYLKNSSVSDFLDGLFLICRPLALSISTRLQYDNTFVELLVVYLQDKVNSWQHPLKDIQVESIDLGKHGVYNRELNFRIRLRW